MTHHAARQSTRHQRETNEQECPRPPHRTRITKAFIAPHPIFVDEIDDDHAEE